MNPWGRKPVSRPAVPVPQPAPVPRPKVKKVAEKRTGSPPPKEPMTVKLKPTILKQFVRQANDNDDRPAPLAEKILESFTRGLFFCPLCYMPHKPSEGCSA